VNETIVAQLSAGKLRANHAQLALALEAERAASIEPLASGRIVEGTAVLHRVLGAVGLSAPGSVLNAVYWLIVYRVRLATSPRLWG